MVLAAVGQMCSRASVSANLAAAVSIVQRASEAGAQLVELPEAADFVSEQSLVPSLLRPLDESEFVKGIQKAAQHYKVFIGVGVHEQLANDPKRCFNTHLLVNSSGEILSAYRKTHLFDVEIPGGATILESRTTAPGRSLEDPVDTPVGKGEHHFPSKACWPVC